MISFGEGIIAGFFFSIFAVIFLVKLAQEDTNNSLLYVMNGLIITMSIVLAIGNACQMGLVDQVYIRGVGNTENYFFSGDTDSLHLKIVGV